MATTPKAVKLYNGSFIVSDDDFKTFKKVEILDDYVPLKSSNKSTEVILRCEYGDRKARVLIDEFKAINVLLNQAKRQDDGYGHAFEVFAIAVHYDLTYDQVIEKHIIGGSDDGKIDAIVWDDTCAYVYQVKMNNCPLKSDLEAAEQNYIEFSESENISNPNTKDLKTYLQKHKDDLKDKEVRFCTVSIDKTGEYNINSKEIFNKFFIRRLLPQTSSNVELYVKINRLKDKATGRMVKNFAKSDTTTFMFAEANDLLSNLYSQGINSESDKLFYENVRGTLGENAAMQETIHYHPEKFELYNNGISIIGKIRQSATHLIVSDPMFINGQQTLYNLMLAREKNEDLSKVIVPIFFKDEEDHLERLNIAKYNNTQRQVKNLDLLSIHSDLRHIQEYLLQKAINTNFQGDYFFLQIVSSGVRSSDLYVKKLFAGHIIHLSDFIRVYWLTEKRKRLGAWKNNISQMIDQEIIKTNYKFSVDSCEKVCKTIKQYYDFLAKVSTKQEKGVYRIADVAFMYLLYFYDINTTQKIIDYIYTELCKGDGKTAGLNSKDKFCI